jgi:hypothetical protein
MPETGLGQGLDDPDLVRGGDRAGLDLKPIARAFLVIFYVCWQIAHRVILSNPPP